MRGRAKRLVAVFPFIGPTLLLNAFVILIPSVLTFGLAFFKWDGIGTPVFVGVRNFLDLFSDPAFIAALKNNFIWTIIFLTIPVGMGLLGAELLRRTHWQFLEPFYFAPVILPIVIVCIIWTYIYHPMRGLGKYLGISLLGRSSTALYAIAFANIWAWWGFLCVVFYGAIQGISKDLYEAAVLDGANRRQEFWYVTLPQIIPTFIFMEIVTIIWSFQVFDWVWVTTQGGPGYATELLATLLFKKSFYLYKVGEATVIGVIISFMGFLAVGILYYLRHKGIEA